MSQYYYLISSLPELARDGAFLSHPYPVFEEFLQEELLPADYTDLKRCFLLNDITFLAESLSADGVGNAVHLPVAECPDPDQLKDMEDPDGLYPFLQDILYDLRSEHRQFPNMSIHWELMYRSMTALVSPESGGIPGFSGFPLDYLVFEARLKNLVTALSYRRSGRAYTDEIITFDDFSKSIALSGSQDFGIQRELGAMEHLPDVFSAGDPLDTERTIVSTRWTWLDDYVDYQVFSREFVFSYALKIADVQRWLVLTPEEGRRSLDGLLNSLQRNIRSITHEEYSE